MTSFPIGPVGEGNEKKLLLPLVTVIMNCSNSSQYLREAIDSVYSQTYANWEIIFWDNASTDGSAVIATSYDSRLKYFHGEKTINLGAARNKAIEQACGEFIAFLDCDDIWLPSKLEKQIPLFDDSKVSIVYSDVIEFNTAGIEKKLYDRRKFYTGECFRELLCNYFLSLVTVVVRHSALMSQPNWFDERLQMSEDYELFCRLAYSGRLAMVRDPLAKYRIHLGSLTITRPEVYWDENELILAKYQELFPNFNIDFRKEIKNNRLRTLCTKAISCWIAGNSVVARSVLRPYIKHLRPFLVYLLSFSPPLIGRVIKSRRGVTI